MADYHGLPVYFIERGEYFDRQSTTIAQHKGDYFDNCERFIFFCRAALSAIRHLDMQCARRPRPGLARRSWPWPIWPSGGAAIRTGQGLRTVMSIHNLAYQGRFSYRLFEQSGLPLEAWNMEGVEFYNSFNLLKAGIAYADKITTVSPQLCLRNHDPRVRVRAGGHPLTRRKARTLVGILNGADYSIWSPENDPDSGMHLFGGRSPRAKQNV